MPCGMAIILKAQHISCSSIYVSGPSRNSILSDRFSNFFSFKTKDERGLRYLVGGVLDFLGGEFLGGLFKVQGWASRQELVSTRLFATLPLPEQKDNDLLALSIHASVCHHR